jgi:hypothetical protein
MVLAIKIRDNIRADRRTVSPITFGENHFDASNAINSIFNNTDDVNFSIFANTILTNFNCLRAYNLYYLADSNAVAETLFTQFSYNINSMSSNPAITPESLPKVENFLNYFGFEIDKYPTPSQLSILENLRSTGIIDYYWIEGDIYLPLATKSIHYPTAPNTQIDTNGGATLIKVENNIHINDFETDLKISDSDNRGLGATIITFEEDATDDITFLRQSTQLLSEFVGDSAFAKVIGQVNRTGKFDHQISTLVSIFGKNPATITQPELQFNGIATDANVIITSVKPIPVNGDYMAVVRKKIMEIKSNNIVSGILLLEFEVDIYNGKSKKAIGRYPISIFKDITRMLSYMASQNNTIVVMGSGNMGVNFDKLKNPPWASLKTQYNDLSKNDSSIIMVGATQNSNTDFVANIGTLSEENTNNISASLDVYMYTDFAIIGLNNQLMRYGGTSASVALVAAIIAFLQGKATQNFGGNHKPISTSQLKKTFKNTFLKNMRFPDRVLTPTTLENLWIECQKVMQNPRP